MSDKEIVKLQIIPVTAPQLINAVPMVAEPVSSITLISSRNYGENGVKWKGMSKKKKN